MKAGDSCEGLSALVRGKDFSSPEPWSGEGEGNSCALNSNAWPAEMYLHFSPLLPLLHQV